MAQAEELAHSASERLQRYVKEDPRLRQNQIPDAPQKGPGFALSADEFIEQGEQRLCGNAGDTTAAHRSFNIAPGHQFLWRHLQSLRQGTK